jgi:hypothetical protein
MGRWLALAGVTAAALLAATSSVAAPPPAPNPAICRAWGAILDKVFREFVPPAVTTETGLGGRTVMGCVAGSVTIWDYKATEQTYAQNAPKSGTVVKGPCTKAVTFTGTNTTIATNAATGKSKTETFATDNFLCFDAPPHPQLIRITEQVARLTPGFEKTFLDSAKSFVVSAAFRDAPPPAP